MASIALICPNLFDMKITTDIHNDVEAQNLLLDESVRMLLASTIMRCFAYMCFARMIGSPHLGQRSLKLPVEHNMPLV